MNMISYTTCLYLDTSRSFNKFTDIIMKSLQIIFTDFWARGFDVENQMNINFDNDCAIIVKLLPFQGVGLYVTNTQGVALG